ncbi:MAG: hypothetical protein ACAF41_10370 [Leptolyngbya sp. BL-A-14]
MTITWQSIGNIPFKALTESRLQLHYGIQFIAATGAALAESIPDYSHTSLLWNPTLKAFVGTAIQATHPFQVALDPDRLTLSLLNQQSESIASLPLTGKTMAEGLQWLKQEVSKLGTNASKIVFLDYPPDDFPAHPLAQGAHFDGSQTLVLNELTAYYANTHLLLEPIISKHEDTSAIRIWPHHFDMATLIMLPGTKDGSPLTVGVGFSPGDASYDEPYWYVSPYPYPATERLPALDGHGFWHTQHWVGAVLTASQLPESISAEAQQQQVESFLNSALGASIALLQVSSPAEV